MKFGIHIEGLSDGWFERYLEDLHARVRRGEFGPGVHAGFGRRRLFDARRTQARGEDRPEFLSSNQDSDEL